jgi:hypothetical protein
MRVVLKPTLNWLLVFLPLAVWAEHAQPDSHRLIFISAARVNLSIGIAVGSSTQIAANRRAKRELMHRA